jgi:hypothetical protein
MKSEFLEYSLEQLLDEESFILWVLHGENNLEWGTFIDSNPVIIPKVIKAKEFIRLHSDRFEKLDENSVWKIWKEIDNYHDQHNYLVRKFHFRKKLSWAAAVFMLVSLGLFGYIYFNEKDLGYKFTSDSLNSSEACLVLSSGERIALTKDNSTITVNDAANQVIVNDSIIEFHKNTDIGKQKIQINAVVIPYGMKSELLLADGTKVWLNAGSRLAFPSKFIGKIREVYLEGEACFKVKKDEKRPFIVKAGELDIKVLGTFFNVSAYMTDATIETVLLDGSVAIVNPKAFGLGQNEIVLVPNQKASFSREVNEISVSDESDVDLYVAWTNGFLKYERESISSVLKKVERYYNVEIHLPSNYPGDDEITGKLDLKESLDAVMVVLADASGFEYRIIKNKVIIQKKLEELKR